MTTQPPLPLHPPPQPMNSEFASGAMYRVTPSSPSNVIAHVPGQSMPAGVEVTRPAPLPTNSTSIRDLSTGGDADEVSTGGDADKEPVTFVLPHPAAIDATAAIADLLQCRRMFSSPRAVRPSTFSASRTPEPAGTLRSPRLIQ
jgi:hypothetical protein